MKIRRSLLKEIVTVETFAGENAYGPVFASAVEVACHIDTTRHLVRNLEGEEVVSEATLYVHPESEATFTPESRLTIGTRASTVLSVNPRINRGMTSHIEVACS